MFNKYLKGLLVVMLIILSMNVYVALSQISDNATVTVTVGNSAPTVSSIGYVDASYATTTSYDPDNSVIVGINATIGDANTLADIRNVTFYLYDNSIHSADYESATPNGYDLITGVWEETGGTWVLDDGSFTEWTESTSIDPSSDSVLSSFEFTFRFDISRGAYADVDWESSVRVYDKANSTSIATAAGFVTMNNYFAVTWSTSTIAFGSVTALSTDNIAIANRTLTIYANAQWELRFDAVDWTSGGETDVDMETVDSLKWDEDGVVGGTPIWVRNTQATATGTWDNQARMSATETPITRNAHFWFDDSGDFTTDKEYTTTLTAYIFANV